MEVTNFRPHDKGALKGFFDLKVEGWGNLIIRGMQLFQKGERAWVNFPSKEFQKDGEKMWMPLMKFEDKEVEKRFSKEVVKLAQHEARQFGAPSAEPSVGNASENMPF